VERSDRVARTHGSSWSWLVPLVVVGLGAWLVIGLIRAVFRGGGSPGGMAPGMGGGYGYGGSGGGGFLSSLMGGLFGAAAGMWMYDRFFGHDASASSWTDPGRDNTSDGFQGQDTSFSGSGGDFGDNSGNDSGNSSGGDFGGGSSGDSGGWGDSGGGGGDFGGGDSGGGGDF
jgi:uncharacterized protein